MCFFKLNNSYLEANPFRYYSHSMITYKIFDKISD